MKVKLIVEGNIVEFEKRINDFIKDKYGVDIKFSEWASGFSALILYK